MTVTTDKPPRPLRTRVVRIVDDDPSFLDGVCRYLRAAGLSVRGYNSPRCFLDHLDEEAQTPGCLILDMAMPELDGLALFRALSARNCALPVVFLTAHADITRCVEAIKSGALDYLLKPVDVESLRAAIDVAFAEDQRRREQRARIQALCDRFSRLSPREHEVGELVVLGHRNKDIASALVISEKTVKVHRGQVMRKLEADSLADLVRLWTKRVRARI